MGKSPPDPPDYTAAAEATGEASRQNIEQQTWANRPSQVNPWGTVDWGRESVWDDTTEQYINDWTQTTNLNPQSQAALDAQLGLATGRSELAGGMMGDIEGMMGSAMDFSKYGGLQGPDGQPMMTGAGEGMSNFSLNNLPAYQRQELQQNMNFNDPGLNSQDLQRSLDYSGASAVDAPEYTQIMAEMSLYDRGASRLDLQMAQESQALDVKLRSQGLNPGDEAYDAQMGNFTNYKTDAYQALSNEASMAGGAEAQRMFDMQMGKRGMMTGEQDSMGNFYNAAASGAFGMDALKQSQAYDITSGQAEFANNAAMDQMSADLAARLGEGNMQLAQAQMGNENQMNAWNQQMAQGTYNQNLDFREADYANMLRETGMNEEMMQRQQRLNEVNALVSGQQVANPQFQNFNQAGSAQAADYLGAAGMQGQHDVANFSAGQQLLNSAIGGASQIGGMWAGSGFG